MDQLPANQLLTSEITFENYENVYEYYGQQELHSFRPKAADLITPWLFHPRVAVPEATQEYIDRCHESNIPLILVANHLQYHDHNVLSSAIHKVDNLREHTVAKTIALIKPEYVQKDDDKREKRELSNGVPIFRSKDMGGIITSKMLIDSNDSAINKMLIPRLSKGHNVFMFIEGTRNLGDWTKLQKIGGLIGRLIARTVELDFEVGIVNAGIAYKHKDMRGLIRPFVQFGHTELDDISEHHAIRRLTGNDLQYSVDLANYKITS